MCTVAVLSILIYSILVSVYTYSNCHNVYGGDWILVRHSYNRWHNASDNLEGTDDYGTYDNDPQSTDAWSIPFKDALNSNLSTLFMFSNGDCSEYLVTMHSQFAASHNGMYQAHIIASHYGSGYDVSWWFDDAIATTPWISWLNQNVSTHTYSILYAEGDTDIGMNRFNAGNNSSVNVWIKVSKYFYGLSHMTWTQSKIYCESQGSSLATINSAHDQQLAMLQCMQITYNLTNEFSGCWIGLNDKTIDRTWEWVDGTEVNFGFYNHNASNPTVGMFPWNVREPSYLYINIQENCVHLWAWDGAESIGYKWNDETCDNATINPLCNQIQTNNPTNDPTTDPTNDPTTDPTTDTTNDPTNDPTTDPTNDPTNNPANDPISPTFYIYVPEDKQTEYIQNEGNNANTDTEDQNEIKTDSTFPWIQVILFAVIIAAFIMVAACSVKFCYHRITEKTYEKSVEALGSGVEIEDNIDVDKEIKRDCNAAAASVSVGVKHMERTDECVTKGRNVEIEAMKQDKIALGLMYTAGNDVVNVTNHNGEK